MSEHNRVFITGMSALTPSGHTLEDTWSAVKDGSSAIAPIEQWDLSGWTHRLGGELKNIQLNKMLPDRKLLKLISRQDVFGIHAAIRAVEDSQLITYRDSLPSPVNFNDETAVFVGSPGNKYLQQYDFLPLLAKTGGSMQPFAQHLFSEVHPMWLLRILPNNVLAYTGITYGFKGINHNITNHAVGGMQAILEAYHAIRIGKASRAVVVAYDVGTEPQALYYYAKLGVISPRHLKPFDSEHDGTLLAEGAAALVLESEHSVRERSAICYGEVVIGLSATEASGLFSLQADGKRLSEIITRTLGLSQLEPEAIGMVVAHGNGNKKSDVSEALALQQAFGAHHVPVTAFKWSMGHTLCASGIVDTVLAVKALQSGCIPAIANLNELAPECAGLNVSATHRMASNISHAMVINRGFASMNACLVIKRCG